jgi:uncharacterized protein YecE (DUF72 family)
MERNVASVRDSPDLHEAARELAARAVDMSRILTASAIEDRRLLRGGRKAFGPDRLEGLPLSHAIEARHDSFACDGFTTLLRERKIAAVQAADSDYPEIDAATAPFASLRIMGTREDEPAGTGHAARCVDVLDAHEPAPAVRARVQPGGERRDE